MSDAVMIPFTDRYSPATTAEEASRQFFQTMNRRRSVRMFSDQPVSRETIEWIVRSAHTAPSGANKQPWRFVCVSDPALKREIRLGAEAEEREFYSRRANAEWLEDLKPLGTDDDKAFLEVAPWLIVVFKLTQTDQKSQVYYSSESVGLACGFLLAAAHLAGLATLTHTPSPMKFLATILGRPSHERPFLLIPVGYAAGNCLVPAAAVTRRPLEEVMVVNRPTIGEDAR